MDENINKKSEKIFHIARLYVKEQNCKIPNGPQIFEELSTLKTKQEPKTSIEMNMRSEKLNPEDYEVVFKLQLTSKLNERTLYLAEIHQAGIFKIKGFSDSDLAVLLNVQCPHTLFPFLRKSLADLIQAAGFVPLLLEPINFEALYQQKLAQQRQEATEN